MLPHISERMSTYGGVKWTNLLYPSSRDNGNDFSFPVPSPFLKLNDNWVRPRSGGP